ncbi:hypothetical protein CALCODRAFT_490593 [Calocera cornea HHB12733]|uniref:Uncharacterized protein n=1 Tax=Calocera cornea HHB12733 TaxID=1353952 RepID=A0A165JMG3_9BASI|nr:hypothetical protein CALCODRAFT_490593 [Calocera cornea HHB12733]
MPNFPPARQTLHLSTSPAAPSPFAVRRALRVVGKAKCWNPSHYAARGRSMPLGGPCQWDPAALH